MALWQRAFVCKQNNSHLKWLHIRNQIIQGFTVKKTKILLNYIFFTLFTLSFIKQLIGIVINFMNRCVFLIFIFSIKMKHVSSEQF